jgi:phospholipid/cholesterol/gamma-HCH transport system substrate-binding protein
MRQSGADVAVGAFVVVAGGLLLWGTLLVGRVPAWLGSEVPMLYARFENVSGLREETDVSIAGVPVGEVSEIELDGARALVKIRIDNDSVQIPADSLIAIRSKGLLGEKVLEIVPGRSATLLEPGGVITRTRSTGNVDELVDRIAQVADDVRHVSASLRNALGGPDGEEAIREVLANTRVLAGALRRMVEDNDERVEGIARNLESFSSDLGDFTADNRASLQEMVESFREASSRLHVAIDSIAEVSQRLERGEGTAGRLLRDEKLYENLDGAVEEARAALVEVRRAAEETQEQVPATILTTLLGSLF